MSATTFLGILFMGVGIALSVRPKASRNMKVFGTVMGIMGLCIIIASTIGS